MIDIKVGNKLIGYHHPTFIVAEIGINANGDINIAKQLIDVAVVAGCDAVKFQKRTITVVFTQEELCRPRISPFGETNGDLKRGLEFDFNQYEAIDEYCAAKEIIWFASAWDAPAVRFLNQFKVPVHKVASASLTDHSILAAMKVPKRPVFMSIGMSDYQQIKDANALFPHDYPLVLLATTSTYPCAIENLNLRKIQTLQDVFWDRIIGYSGHEVGLWTTLAAVAMGANVIERHITLDRTMWGSDQAASVEPQGLIRLVKEIRDLEKAKGNGKLEMIDAEVPVMEKLRRVR